MGLGSGIRDPGSRVRKAPDPDPQHCVFPSPAGMSLTKLSLAGNNLIIPSQGEFVSDIPVEDGKKDNLFYSV
jgi:hypothetical protein